jgi:hypothetical protein
MDVMVVIANGKKGSSQLIHQAIAQEEKKKAGSHWLLDGKNNSEVQANAIPYRQVKLIALDHIEHINNFKESVNTILRKFKGGKKRLMIVTQDKSSVKEMVFPKKTTFLNATGDSEYPFQIEFKNKLLNVDPQGKMHPIFPQELLDKTVEPIAAVN